MNKKSPYTKPIITVSLLEIESALAAGSARVLGPDDNFFMHEEWVDEPEAERTIDW